jgi:dihydroneopterin aldolase
MLTIHLSKLRFYAYHGLFAEERILGSHYELDLSITLDTNERVSSLDRSIDYAAVFELVKKRMAVPTELLETLAADIAASIHQNFSHARSLTISIHKEDPPISQMQGSVGVSLTKTF